MWPPAKEGQRLPANTRQQRRPGLGSPLEPWEGAESWDSLISELRGLRLFQDPRFVVVGYSSPRKPEGPPPAMVLNLSNLTSLRVTVLLTRHEENGSHNDERSEQQPSDEQKDGFLLRNTGGIFKCLKNTHTHKERIPLIQSQEVKPFL